MLENRTGGRQTGCKEAATQSVVVGVAGIPAQCHGSWQREAPRGMGGDFRYVVEESLADGGTFSAPCCGSGASIDGPGR
jgi:hypothetical protein